MTKSTLVVLVELTSATAEYDEEETEGSVGYTITVKVKWWAFNGYS
jgi:hypothetical protein